MKATHVCYFGQKKSKYLPAIGFLHKLVCVVSETTGWADGCHIRWPGWGVSVILLRCPSDILLGGPTFCATDACTKSYMKSYTRNIFSSPSSSSWYPPWGSSILCHRYLYQVLYENLYQKYIFITIFFHQGGEHSMPQIYISIVIIISWMLE